MKFTINPTLTKTEPQYLKTGETELKMLAFESKIEGLTMHLLHAGNGLKQAIPINDTKTLISKNIADFGLVWFEYTSTDKKYVIELFIK